MLKKTLAIALLGCSTLVLAQGGYVNNAASGYTGPGTTINLSNIKQALTLPDDSKVRLQGKLVKQLSKDKYQLQDNTGTITVEIDQDKWRGQVVGPNDIVELYGEIDKDRRGTEVDVDLITKMN
ncbi:MAG: YgiW/YdeI family stress tolerance OB fold protein [Neisseriaceae bacterium]|nr:YgiW/YdeI family stress tolerance OB fold protein [Neisseriaceae bacterium]MBP6860911.1 YgiW/YdeI family stress tolerance OB fold protein [Neisseriaceae bacterium]